MEKFDKLNNDLKSAGFKIEDDLYTLDKVTYQTTIINGRQFQQPQHSILKMKYIGDGCEVDDSEECVDGTEFFEFGIMDGDEMAVTICIRDFEELKEYINV